MRYDIQKGKETPLCKLCHPLPKVLEKVTCTSINDTGVGEVDELKFSLLVHWSEPGGVQGVHTEEGTPLRGESIYDKIRFGRRHN